MVHYQALKKPTLCQGHCLSALTGLNVASIKSREKLFSVLLAASFLVQSNLACFAAESVAVSQISDVVNSIESSDTILKSPLLIAAGDPAGFVLSGGASVTPEQAPDRADQLSRAILLKEIELERYNLHYSQEVAIQGRWKGWRYGTLQIANNGLGLAGAITGTSYRGARLDDAAKVKPAIQEQANFVPEIGAYIGAGAAAMEFGINGYHDIVARRHGFGPADAYRKVSVLKADIDKLLTEREAVVKIENSAAPFSMHAEVDAAEGKVLRDLRDQGLEEFERFHVGARRLIAFQQMQYFLDFSKYTLNGLGYEFAALSLHRHRRRYNGNAGALFVVSGAVTIAAPVISRFTGKGVALLTEHKLRPIVGDANTTAQNLEQDLATLNALLKTTQAAPDSIQRTVDRSGMLAVHQQAFSKEVSSQKKKLADAKLSATQNVFSGFYVGGSKVASGVLFCIVGFNHDYNVKTDRANHVTNDDLFAASVIGIPATSYSILDTLRIQVKGEINRHKAKINGTLPSQLVAACLTQLDEQEKRINTIH